MRVGTLLPIFLLFFLQTTLASEPLQVIFSKGEGRGQESSYTYQLLQLALNKSGQPHELKLTELTMPEARARQLIELNDKSVTVVFSGTSMGFEQKLLPVRIPLYGGLLGHRLFLIHQDNTKTFSKIKSLADLRQLTSGQGSNWSDIEILEAAGLKVHTAKYHLLFQLLEKKRIDYFPRGASEIFGEYERFKAELPNLAIEQNVVLVYPFASFYFVSRQNQALHDAIYSGLSKAHADGSFIEFFRSHPETSSVMALAKLDQRKRIDIANPLMTPETLAIAKKYWFNASWQLDEAE